MAADYDFRRKPNEKGDGEVQPLYPRIVSKGTIDSKRLFREIAEASSFTEGDLAGIMVAFQEKVSYYLSEGYHVKLGEIGYFSSSLKARPVMDKKEIRSPSVHFQNVNLRLGSKFRNRFNTMELERKASPYVSRSLMGEEERKEKLLLHLDKYGCITRADYESITGLVKHRAVSDLNRYLAEGMIRKYGSGKTVVYLKP